MRCATTLIASLSMAAAMRLPAMAVPSSSLAPRMYDLRGGGKASSSPFDMLKGRKIVPGWDGDLVDLTQTAAVGIVAGVCSRAVIGVATGVLKSCAVGGIVLYASQYSGFFKLDTAKIKRSARALVGKVDLLGALEKLGFPDDPAGIKAHAFDLARSAASKTPCTPSTRHWRHAGGGPVGGERAPRFRWCCGLRRKFHGLRDQKRRPTNNWGERQHMC